MAHSKTPAGACCVWTEEHDGEFWQTDCGHAFQLTDGTPADNQMQFCAYCGRTLKCGRVSEESGTGA